MEISPTTPSAVAKPQAPATAEKADAKGPPANDFETFLTLLTTQLKNQDPLKPMESTEFVAQLASFSAVEQQVRANDKLEKILQVLSSGSADGLAQWIGKEVRAPAKSEFSGEPVEVEVTPVADADRAVLVARNDFDQVVSRTEVSADAALVSWKGQGDLDESLPNGSYNFALESYQGDTLLDTQNGRVYAQVTEVRLQDGEPVLVLAGGEQVQLDAVTGVR